MSIPSEPSITTINHSSDPSISAIKRSSKVLHGITILLVIFGLAALALTIYLFIENTEKNQVDAAIIEAEAWDVHHVNAQTLLIEDEDPVDPVIESETITIDLESDPTGANVFYADGSYFGTTPIVQKKVPRNTKEEVFIFNIDGYEVLKKTETLTNNIHEKITLTKREFKYDGGGGGGGGGGSNRGGSANNTNDIFDLPD